MHKYQGFYYLTEHGEERFFSYSLYERFDFYQLKRYIYSNVYPFVSINNSSFFYFKDKSSGIRFPLFYIFACGHCDLCLQKKASEYSFRAACESSLYPKDQLFVTLTYAPHSLPVNGVSKDDLQKYFKRLRWRLSVLGLRTDFRYLAVSEYGGKFGRPHYHIIFWNFPLSDFKTVFHAYACIRSAWSDYVFDQAGKRRVVYSKKFSKYYYVRQSRGIVKILPVTYGCSSYIVKYFRKEDHNLLKYPNKTFLLSSRKNGGIGSAYIRSQRDFVLNTFAKDISVLDSVSGKIFTYPITGYIKNCIAPCLSRLFSKNGFYSNIKRIAFYLDLIKACKDLLQDRCNGNLLKIDTWTFYLDFLKYFSRFEIFSTRVSRRAEYTYLRNLTTDKLLGLVHNLIRRISRFFKKNKDLSFVDSLNSLYLRIEAYNKDRSLNFNQSGFFYDLVSNKFYLDSSHSKYLQRCTF